MADATPSRLGQANLTGDQLALFLKVFSGETLAAFDRATDFKNRHMVRVIPSGKSAQFPVTGLATASRHVPGTEITGGQIRHQERVINIEDMLIAPLFIANFDEALNHYEVRSIYANEIAEALAKNYDKDVSRAFALAARAAANLPDLPAGTELVNAAYDTDGTLLYQGIYDASVQLDENDVPRANRNAFVKPVQYALIVQSEKPIDRDLNPQSNGSIAEGLVRRIDGVPIVKTNNVAREDDSANGLVPTALQGNFSNQVAQVAHMSAAGTVQLQDMTMESEYDIRRQGTLMVGKYLKGTDLLRPEAAVTIATAATT